MVTTIIIWANGIWYVFGFYRFLSLFVSINVRICNQGSYEWAFTPIFRGGFDYFKGYLGSQVDYFTFENEYIYDWRENKDVLWNCSDNYTTSAFGDEAIDIIQSISANNDDTPFTLTVAFEAPHGPIHWAPQPWNETAIDEGGPWGKSSNDYYIERQMYATMVLAMDDYIGQIVDALRQNRVNGQRIWDNTYLIFFSDNGGVFTHASNYPLRGAKSTNFEGMQQSVCLFRNLLGLRTPQR